MSISILNRGASGGLKPELTVTAPSGSTIDLLRNGIIIDTYTLGASETEHTFMVKVGTYTVKGTLGEQTKSVEVVIDTVGQYAVEITYRLYLYHEGDECKDVTGGYNVAYQYRDGGYWGSGGASINRTENALQLVVNNKSGGYNSGAIVSKNKIDVSQYSKLCIEYGAIAFNSTTAKSNSRFRMALSDSNQNWTYDVAEKTVAVYSTIVGEHYDNGNSTVELNVSNLTGSYYIFLLGFANVADDNNTRYGGNGYVKTAWLE